VRVGQAAGANDPQRVRLAGRTGILLALGFNLVSTFIMLVFPRQIVALYTDATEVSELAVLLLRLAGLFQIWDALQVAANGALRGIKDTRAPMALTLFAYWGIALPVGYCLGFGLGFGQGYGPVGLWIGLIAGLVAAAIFLNARFYALTRV
ncbi:MAG: MATE family efflux transporter, partial [Nevskiales bacterium]